MTLFIFLFFYFFEIWLSTEMIPPTRPVPIEGFFIYYRDECWRLHQGDSIGRQHPHSYCHSFIARDALRSENAVIQHAGTRSFFFFSFEISLLR